MCNIEDVFSLLSLVVIPSCLGYLSSRNLCLGVHVLLGLVGGNIKLHLLDMSSVVILMLGNNIYTLEVLTLIFNRQFLFWESTLDSLKGGGQADWNLIISSRLPRLVMLPATSMWMQHMTFGHILGLVLYCQLQSL